MPPNMTILNLLLAVLLLVSSIHFAVAASAAPIPGEFADLYGVLDRKLVEFDRRLAREWTGTKSPVVFSAGLITANPNSGESLLDPRTYELSVQYIDRLESLGVMGISLDINFPLLMPDFQSEAKAREYLEVYRRIAGEIRRRGLVVAIESTTVFPDFSSLPVRPYYRQLSLQEYIRRRAEMLRIIATELRPDYLTVGNEPDTEAHNSGQPVNNLDTYARALETYLDVLREAGVRGVKVGAGFGTWQKDYQTWTERYARTGLDFINVHIYPVDGDLLDRALLIADIARRHGKGMVVHEAWLYKWRLGERTGVVASGDIYARDVFSFWQPLDQKFLTVLVALAHAKRLEYVSPFWSNYFFAYMDYEAAKSIPTSQRMKRAMLEGIAAAADGRVTATGQTYSALIRK